MDFDGSQGYVRVQVGTDEGQMDRTDSTPLLAFLGDFFFFTRLCLKVLVLLPFLLLLPRVPARTASATRPQLNLSDELHSPLHSPDIRVAWSLPSLPENTKFDRGLVRMPRRE